MEEELKVRSAAVVQNAEEVAQQRAESNALRFVLKKKISNKNLLKEHKDPETSICNVSLLYLLLISPLSMALLSCQKVLNMYS